MQFPDKVIDIPVVLVAQVPQEQVVPETVGIPQLPFEEKIVVIPGIQTVHGPQTSESLKGEITVAVKIDRETVMQNVAPNIGLDSFIDDFSSIDCRELSHQHCEGLFHVGKQSPDIAGGVVVDRDDHHAGNGDLWRSRSDDGSQENRHCYRARHVRRRRHTAAAQKQAAPLQSASASHQQAAATSRADRRREGKRRRRGKRKE